MCFFLGKMFGPQLTQHHNDNQTLDLKEFYTGNLKARGVARNMFGKVLRRFTADVKGSHQGDKLILNEFFTYDDGRTFDRQWELTQEDEDGKYFKGQGADIFGDITAQTQGCASLLKYTLKIPAKKSKRGFKTLDVTHWQYKIDESHTIHFLKLKKFGLTLINSTVMFSKN